VTTTSCVLASATIRLASTVLTADQFGRNAVALEGAADNSRKRSANARKQQGPWILTSMLKPQDQPCQWKNIGSVSRGLI
jgi:hypothetical protein